MVGPSIPGSEYAMPTSMMSQPDRTKATMASIEVSTSGYPVGGSRSARQFSSRQAAKIGATPRVSLIGAAVEQTEPLCRRRHVLVARPDRFTTITAFSPSSVPSWSAPATAWADSIAGMIPSVRHNRRKASIASLSVTGGYSARPMS